MVKPSVAFNERRHLLPVNPKVLKRKTTVIEKSGHTGMA